MNNRKPSQILKAFGSATLLMTALTGCMTPEELAALNSSLAIGDATGPSVPTPNVGPSCFNERFVQPDAVISRSIDLLFVMDTSGSMSDNRAKVADGISAFVAELPPEVDYQVGVMLGHGSQSAWSGKLFSHNGNKVFSSKTMSLADIKTKLKAMALGAPADASGEQGEEMSYSLRKGLTTHLDANRTAGFFRTNAALAVVYVSDENDICAPYANDANRPGLTNAEKNLRNRDCPGGITTTAIIDKVKEVQGDRPYMFGAVVHKSLSYNDGGNDGYGYGMMETVQATNGVSIEINDGSYVEGLSTLGTLATSKLTLILDHTMAHADIEPSSIKAQVDGTDVQFVYDPTTNDVHLSSGGGARSVVDINYCLKAPAPTPSPSTTPPPAS